jgi:LAS superfamily LD-carboxypeptidase LdcB
LKYLTVKLNIKRIIVFLSKLLLIISFVILPNVGNSNARIEVDELDIQVVEPLIVDFSSILLLPNEVNEIEFQSNRDIEVLGNFNFVELEETKLVVDLSGISNKDRLYLEFGDLYNQSYRQIFIILNEWERLESGICNYSPHRNVLEILVDKHNCIHPDDIPVADLLKIEHRDRIFRIHKVAHTDLVRLLRESQKAGVELTINSAFRDLQEQEYIHTLYKRLYGYDLGSRLSANPEQSEHHLGTAVDFGSVNQNGVKFEQTNEFKWLEENAWRYGFVMSYPKNNQAETGYTYEPWHWRYVGLEHAKNLDLLNHAISLNRYLYIVNQ